MGLGETDDTPPPASLPDPDERPTIAQPGSAGDQSTTVRLPDPDDLGATQESAVLDDDDIPKMKQVLDWALTVGREKDISPELREAVQSGQLSDANIEAKIADMKAARA